MGHKVHPTSFRLGTTTTWPSRWFARDEAYRKHLREDIGIREFFRKELKEAAVSQVIINRSRGALDITISSAKPGMVIGRSGAGIEDLKKKFLKAFFPGKKIQFQLNVTEVAKASLDAHIVAQQVVAEIERRMPFRRVLKMAIERSKKAGALGVKISVSGRLNGAEIARREKQLWGKIPLTNLRADIDYTTDTARTIAGAIGVKVWIYRGDIFEQDRRSQYQPTTPANDVRRGGASSRGRMDDRPRRTDAPRNVTAPTA